MDTVDAMYFNTDFTTASSVSKIQLLNLKLANLYFLPRSP